MKITPPYFLMMLVLLASLAPTARAVVGFSITPSVVSNTYPGKISLVVTGLVAGGTVVVQKFLDANTNGTIGAGDILWQQFNLTDGQASVFSGVTNVNVPGDTDTTAGQITAQLNLQSGDFLQRVVGKYAFKLTSPTGLFTPITNLFTVTNFPYAQSFTGNVLSNGTATTLSNAVVILFQPTANGNMNPSGGGAVANNSGSYTIMAPPGTYLPVAFRSNYLANLNTSPLLTLGSGSTITTNLTLTNTTQTLSGKVVDLNTPTTGIPGFLVPVESTNNFLGLAFTDTNGNFTAGTQPSVWKISGDDQGLLVHGYLALQNNLKTNTAAGSVSGITVSLPKATAIFYGSVKDNLGNPLAGISMSSSDNNQYNGSANTDTNGGYVIGALGGEDWQVNISTDSNPTNYIFSQGTNTTPSVGQAVLYNFTAILAPNHITGHVQDSNSGNIPGVGVYAYATIGGVDYQTQADADGSGNYWLNVPNGSWTVNVLQCCDNDSLDNILGSGNYQTPSSQNVNISNGNGTANFTVQLCSGVQITTTNLPNGQQGSFYDTFLQASSCYPSYNWTVSTGPLPSGLTLDASGELHGTPGTSGTFNFTVQVTDGNSHVTNQPLSLLIATNATPPPPISIAAAGNQLVVFYPLSGSNYVLQTTTNLATGPWVPATNGIPAIAFTFTNTAPAQFYRLH